jgi:single-strand DNA-binding protein
MAIEAAFFGTLGRDAEAKTSAKGKQYVRLAVRIGDGDDVQWVQVTSFDPDALAAAERLVKGAKVYVEGRLTLDEWTGSDGAQRHGLSVLSFHTRLAAIGRNKPQKRAGDSGLAQGPQATPPRPNDFYSDDIDF